MLMCIKSTQGKKCAFELQTLKDAIFCEEQFKRFSFQMNFDVVQASDNLYSRKFLEKFACETQL